MYDLLIDPESYRHFPGVTWTTTYRVPVPVLGPLFAWLGRRRMARAFDDAIRVAGDLATQQPAAVGPPHVH